MGFFSNIIKKIGKFVANVFRDVEKPVKETEKTVKETVKVFEDTGLKAFRGFQKFIEKPIEKIEEVIEEPEEIEEEVIEAEKTFYRKIVKTGNIESDKKGNTEVAWYYKKPKSLYAVTYEDNLIDRREFLINILKKEFSDYELPITYFETYGYDQEEDFFKYEIPNDFLYDGYDVGEEI